MPHDSEDQQPEQQPKPDDIQTNPFEPESPVPISTVEEVMAAGHSEEAARKIVASLTEAAGPAAATLVPHDEFDGVLAKIFDKPSNELVEPLTDFLRGIQSRLAHPSTAAPDDASLSAAVAAIPTDEVLTQSELMRRHHAAHQNDTK